MHLVILFYLHGDRGQILPRGQISADACCNDHQKENQDNQRKSNPDDTPVVKEMKLDFSGTSF